MNEKDLVRHLSSLKDMSPRTDWIRQNREVLSYQIFNGQESIATELGLDLQSQAIQPEARVLTQNNGINPTTYECEIRIVEVLDCKD